MLSMKDKNLISVALPENVDVEDYLNEFYQRAARSGVLVNDFSISSASSLSSALVCLRDGSEHASGNGSSSGASTEQTQTRHWKIQGRERQLLPFSLLHSELDCYRDFEGKLGSDFEFLSISL